MSAHTIPPSSSPKILTLDIETSPNLAHVWSLWKQNVGLNQLIEASEVMCFAAKWLGVRQVEFWSGHHHGKDVMLKAAHHLLSEADAVVTYNGDRFDLPHLNREFLIANMPPPAPYLSLDLLKTVKSQTRFVSNKLDHVSAELGIGHKVRHEGHALWVACLKGDPAAWKRMERYNKQDVRLTESLALRLKTWIKAWPNPVLYGTDPFAMERRHCPACGGTNLSKEGFHYTRIGKYQRYRCRDCGKYSHSGSATARVELR